MNGQVERSVDEMLERAKLHALAIVGSLLLVFGVTGWLQVALRIWVANEGSSQSPVGQYLWEMRGFALLAACGLASILVWLGLMFGRRAHRA